MLRLTLLLAIIRRPLPRRSDGRHTQTQEHHLSAKIAGAQIETYKEINGATLKVCGSFNPRKEARARGETRGDRFHLRRRLDQRSPSQFEPQCRYFAARGMVAITADYRVGSRQQVTPTPASPMPNRASAGCGRMPHSWASIRSGSSPRAVRPVATSLPPSPRCRHSMKRRRTRTSAPCRMRVCPLQSRPRVCALPGADLQGFDTRLGESASVARRRRSLHSIMSPSICLHAHPAWPRGDTTVCPTPPSRLSPPR